MSTKKKTPKAGRREKGNMSGLMIALRQRAMEKRRNWAALTTYLEYIAVHTDKYFSEECEEGVKKTSKKTNKKPESEGQKKLKVLKKHARASDIPKYAKFAFCLLKRLDDTDWTQHQSQVINLFKEQIIAVLYGTRSRMYTAAQKHVDRKNEAVLKLMDQADLFVKTLVHTFTVIYSCIIHKKEFPTD